MEKRTNKTTESQKKRKVSSGPIREKARTMRKLISAVGRVIQKKGYAGLNVASVSKEAGVDRRLVYTYFGSLDNLIEIYIKQKDYWSSSVKEDFVASLEDDTELKSEDIFNLLQGQFDAVLKDKALQKIIHWELGEKNKILREISDNRELLGEVLFKRIEPSFEETNIDIRAILALQIGGLYYLSLHAKANGSLFCGIDINERKGKERIEKALESVLSLCYQKTEINYQVNVQKND